MSEVKKIPGPDEVVGLLYGVNGAFWAQKDGGVTRRLKIEGTKGGAQSNLKCIR